MGMAEEQFAQSLASNGGLGLAKMVVRTMSRAVGQQCTITCTGAKQVVVASSNGSGSIDLRATHRVSGFGAESYDATGIDKLSCKAVFGIA